MAENLDVYQTGVRSDTDDELVKNVVGMVEKPDPADAPSNLVATGRYVPDRKIFDALRRITRVRVVSCN